MRKKVVVTGATGFLGSHLCAALVQKYTVVAFNTTRERTLPSGVKFVQGDCRNVKLLKTVFKGAQYVFHAAALPRVQDSIDHPQETHDVNVNGTLAVLLAARDAGVKRVVFSSSAAVYGDQKEMPLAEDMRPSPKSPYGLHKYIGEEYLKLFGEVYGVSAVSLRYFNIYGPGADPQGPYALAIGKFLEQRRRGKAITITGDGKQTRDFVHVLDVVRANILAATSTKVKNGEIINIGSGRETTVRTVAALIGGPTKHIEKRFEPRRACADITKAKRLLGWRPTTSIEEGIREMKQLYKIV